MTSLTHEFSWPLQAPPERVFAALTQADELRKWFCEHAKLDVREGGAFRFWGRHTYGTPTRDAAASQKVLRFEPGSAIAFSWNVEGQPTTVTLRLETESGGNGKAAGGTVVKGTHHFPEAPATVRASELVDDLWRLHWANLITYLSWGNAALLPDFEDPRPEVRLSVLVDAPRERVFDALLNPDVLNRWIAAAARVDPRPGGTYSYGWTYKVGERDVQGGPTRILEVVENEKLVTDWPDWRGDPSVPVQTVTWLLESVGPQTRVTLIHGGFTRVSDVGDYPGGWRHFLQQLQQALLAGPSAARPDLAEVDSAGR